ncbi:MAG: NAD(+) diphosphatase [Paracoccaceae bacterium]
MSVVLPVTFAVGGPKLDRATHLRASASRLMRDPHATVLILHSGRPLIAQGDGWRRLAMVPPGKLVLQMVREDPVFLGLIDEAPWFAADLSHLPEERVEAAFIAGAKFLDLRSVAGEIVAAEATLAATGKGLLGWHATHGFCARCGTQSVIEDAGWRRRCPACTATHFPRIDPVVIMLVIDGDRVLLGRQHGWPDRMYSLLAGFMEPGETIEDAVRRETQEEAGIEIGRVHYLACQPWPFPSSLMLGCAGEALSREIAIDHQELEDALWVAKSDMPDILAGKHQRIAAPRASAIARVLLSAWASGEVPPF